mmetsp:Transcript_11504/g.22009  ORF Transcript_11504/g.22009 Transcript_11504/m.22009 type:complete len:111 (-) Transcript_11504:671-1003(-)
MKSDNASDHRPAQPAGANAPPVGVVSVADENGNATGRKRWFLFTRAFEEPASRTPFKTNLLVPSVDAKGLAAHGRRMCGFRARKLKATEPALHELLLPCSMASFRTRLQG